MQSHFRDFHRRAFGGWCLVFALALPATGLAKPAMSLQEAIRLATVRAPLLEARRAGVTAAQEDAARAGALAIGRAHAPVRPFLGTGEIHGAGRGLHLGLGRQQRCQAIQGRQ